MQKGERVGERPPLRRKTVCEREGGEEKRARVYADAFLAFFSAFNRFFSSFESSAPCNKGERESVSGVHFVFSVSGDRGLHRPLTSCSSFSESPPPHRPQQSPTCASVHGKACQRQLLGQKTMRAGDCGRGDTSARDRVPWGTDLLLLLLRF